VLLVATCITTWKLDLFASSGEGMKRFPLEWARRKVSIAVLKDFLHWAYILWRKMKLEKYKNKILWRAAWKLEYLNWSDRQLLRNVYNHNAYFSGNGIRTCFSFRGNEYASVSCVAKQEMEGFNRVSSLQSANKSKEDGYWLINHGEAGGERSTKHEEQFRTVQIRAKETPVRRGPEQSKVKWYQKTSLWVRCCTFMKWTTVVIPVNIPTKSRSNPELMNYLLSRKPNMRPCFAINTCIWKKNKAKSLYIQG
jgi:hypothetical protein